jgi:hypothetical protein
MRKLVGATLLSLALAVGLAAPADAGRSVVVTDAPNDAKNGIDMRAVAVKRLSFGIQVRTSFSHIGRNLNGMQYYFDTVRRQPGPEFGAVIYRDKDGDRLTGVHVYRMDGWRRIGAEVTCTHRFRWAMRPNGTGHFTAAFGLGCMKAQPGTKVRVAARSWDYTRYRGRGEMRRPVFGHDDLMKRRHFLSPRV